MERALSTPSTSSRRRCLAAWLPFACSPLIVCWSFLHPLGSCRVPPCPYFLPLGDRLPVRWAFSCCPVPHMRPASDRRTSKRPPSGQQTTIRGAADTKRAAHGQRTSKRPPSGKQMHSGRASGHKTAKTRTAAEQAARPSDGQSTSKRPTDEQAATKQPPIRRGTLPYCIVPHTRYFDVLPALQNLE